MTMIHCQVFMYFEHSCLRGKVHFFRVFSLFLYWWRPLPYFSRECRRWLGRVEEAPQWACHSVIRNAKRYQSEAPPKEKGALSLRIVMLVGRSWSGCSLTWHKALVLRLSQGYCLEVNEGFQSKVTKVGDIVLWNYKSQRNLSWNRPIPGKAPKRC